MGGGGDGGASARQAEIEKNKAKARESLNRQFGIFGDAPTRSQFVSTRVVGVDPETGNQNNETFIDEGAYQAALADYNDQKAQNEASGGRDALYQSVRDNAYTAGKRGLDESRDQAARQTKFELFARGLNGGSEDIDQNALLGRTYSQGLLDLGAKADAAKSQFKSDDETTRLNLLQSIDAGMDAGSASSSAMNQMRNNADRAAAAAQGTSLGDLFANSGLIYTQSQAAKGKADGAQWWNNYSPSVRSTSATAKSGWQTSTGN